MKRTVILLLILQSFIRMAGQQTGESFILNEPIPPNQTREWIASRYIDMIPDFSAAPEPGKYVRAAIDPMMVFPPDEGETGGPSNNNTGGVVGTLPGNVMVSPTGAATYNIPINLPPGVAGVTPSLSLAYNSQGGNGLLGIGWSLSGLSAITRTGTTIYNDGFIDGVDFDSNDKLALDGQRLIAVNNSTEYRTEIETFTKITPMEVADGWPKWFEVRTKDGRIMEYGNTNDSRIEATGKNSVLFWLVNRISDRKGNYISFEYTEYNGMGRIKKISYGGNSKTGQQPYYFVEFHYTTGRQDKIVSYVSGSKIEISEILTDITVKYRNETTDLQHYNLMYDWGTYTHLLNVTLYDKNGKHINPTLFEWGEDNASFNLQTTNIQNSEYSSDYTMGDFNGDGKTDVVSAYYSYDQSNKKNYHYWTINYSSGNGNYFDEQYMGDLNYPYDGEFAYFISGDFNGDGLDDLILFKFHDYGEYSYYTNQYLFSNGEGFDIIQGFQASIMGNYYLRTGDFNGNGILDVLLIKNIPANENSDDYYTLLTAYEYDLQSHNFNSLFTNPPNTEGYSWLHTDNDLFKVQTGDFNGDGKTDLLVNMHELESTIFTVDETTNTLIEIPEQRFGFPNKYHRVFTGDFNGDGISDILTFAYTNPDINWEMHLYNGKNNWVQINCPLTRNHDPNASSSDNHYIISDYNGDGKSDILEVFNKYNGGQIEGSWFNVFYSNGLSFSKEVKYFDNYVPFYSYFYPNFDFNGDSKADIFLLNYWSNPKKILFLHKDEQKYLTKKITNGLGHETQITYKPLTDNNIYTKGTGAVYPLADIQPALYVVDSVLANNGLGGKAVTLYRYEGAKVHQQGKGFLGYRKTTTVNFPSTGKSVKTINTFRFNEDYYFRWLENSKSFADTHDDDDVLISETTNKEPFIKAYADKRIFFYTPASVTKVYHTGDDNSSYVKTVLKTQHFNEGDDLTYGNVSFSGTYVHSEELDLNNPVSDYDYATESEFVYNYDPPAIDDWLISRIISQTTQANSKNDPTGSSDAEKVTYLYDGNSPYVKEEKHIPNKSTEMTTVSYYDYDDYGNISRTKHAAPYFSPRPPDRITEYVYSPDFQHRFVTETKKTVDDIRFVSTTDYYPETGLVKSKTDVNGLTTTYYYDGFGKLKKTISPEGVEHQEVWRWAGQTGENPQHGLYKMWSQSSGEAPATVYYDQLGRELRSKTENFRNEPVYTDKEYNDRGQVQRTSAPYFAGEEKQWTQYTYLVTGAVKTMTTPVNTIKYTYDGRTTATENITTGIITSKEVDAIGNMIKATDPGGTIEYTYYSSGQLYTVSPGGITTTITYDAAGFQETLNDPDAATTTYNYNPFGELISQTDNRGNQYEMLYDALGRIKTKTLTNENQKTNYYYDNEENGLGLLSRVVGWNGISTNFKYDDLSRVTEKTETINGNDYTYNYQYDVFGRLKTETWPTGFAVSRQYKNGYMTRVRQTATDKTLWELTDITARGQVKQYKLGNGLLTTKGFTATGFLTEIETGNIQHLKYNFDETTGNLNWREDLSGGIHLHEDFTYDDKLKSRLETWQVAGQNLYAISYADNGNINSKTGVGSGFEYGTGLGAEQGAGVHAVIRINQPATDYLNMVQNIQEIDYTGFNKARRIIVRHPDKGTSDGDNVDEQWTMDIVYGPDNYRRTTTLIRNREVVKSKLFVGGKLEVETDAGGQKRYLHYISGGDGLCAIYVTGNENDKGAVFYILKDHLGSLYALTDENGDIVKYNGQQQVYSFDPWGRRRNPTDWTFNNVPDANNYLIDRGFTGHEHLDELGLINMNGRMYDPVLARMLSPDNFVQAPGYTQNLNRYSYALNNPLKYTDPDGEWINLVIGAAIGGAVGYISGRAAGLRGWDLTYYTIASAGIGAISGGIGGAVSSSISIGGSAIVSGAVSGAAGGAAAGFVAGAGTAALDNTVLGTNYNILTKGLIGAGIGAAAGFAIGGIRGVIQYNRQMTLFQKGCETIGVEVDEAVPATDKFLSDAQQAWYEDAPMDKINKFTTENVPAKLQLKMDKVGASGATRYLQRGGILTGRSNVYFNKNLAFTSAKQLFFTMGHELVHVSQYAALAGQSTSLISKPGFIDLLEFHAYSYQHSLGGLQLNSFTPDVVRSLAAQYPTYFRTLSYVNFGWTSSASFVYPF